MDNFNFSTQLNKCIQKPLKKIFKNDKIKHLKLKFKKYNNFKYFKKIFNYYRKNIIKYIHSIIKKIKHSFSINIIYCDDNGQYLYYEQITRTMPIKNTTNIFGLKQKCFVSNYKNITDNQIFKLFESYKNNSNIIENKTVKRSITNIVNFKKSKKFIATIVDNLSVYSLFTGSSVTYSYTSMTVNLLANSNYFYPNDSSVLITPNPAVLTPTTYINYCTVFPYLNFFTIENSHITIANSVNIIAGGSGGCATPTRVAGASGAILNCTFTCPIAYNGTENYYVQNVQFGYNQNVTSRLPTWYYLLNDIITPASLNEINVTGTVIQIIMMNESTSDYFYIGFFASDANFNMQYKSVFGAFDMNQNDITNIIFPSLSTFTGYTNSGNAPIIPSKI